MHPSHGGRGRFVLAPALALALAGLLPGALAAQEESKSSAVESLLRPGTTAFLHVRVADVWKSPQLETFRKLLASAGPKDLQELQKKFAPAPSAVESLTVIYPTPEAQFDLPDGDPMKLTTLWVVVTKEPYDRLALVKSVGPEGRTKKYRNGSYYFDDARWSGLVFLDDRTFVYGSEDAIVQMLDRLADGREAIGSLALLFRREAGKHPVMVGVSPSVFVQPELLRFVPEDLQPLFKAKHWSAALDLEPATKAVAELEFADEEQARAGEKAVRVGLDLFRKFIGQGIREMEKQLAQKPARRPGGLQELPEAFGPLVALATLRKFDSLAKDLPLETKGNTVRATHGLDDLLPGGGGTAAVLMVFLAERTIGGFGSSAYVTGPENEERNLQRLYAAMERYYRDKGTYPPPAIYDPKTGDALLSWRVLLLPYMEDEDVGQIGREPFVPAPFPPKAEGPRNERCLALYKEFRLDEPWDSLHNKKLLAKMPQVFRSGYYEYRPAARYKTGMEIFVGPGAVFNGRSGARKDEIKDGLDQTILIASSVNGDTRVFWTKPADLPYAADKPLPALTGERARGFHAVFADGQVRLIKKSIPEKSLRALITIADGMKVHLSEVSESRYQPKSEPKFEPKFEKEK